MSTILVVDDKQLVREAIGKLLEYAGFEVLTARNGREAWAMMYQRPPDLVLLDLMMPNVDGWTVAEALADDEGTRDIPIVFLTARATTNDRMRAEKLGALGYVLKPFDPVRLAPLVTGVVARCSRGEADELRRERPQELWPADLEG